MRTHVANKTSTAISLSPANVKRLIEQPEAGHWEGLTAYLNFGRFHNYYSFGNVLEIARGSPTQP